MVAFEDWFEFREWCLDWIENHESGFVLAGSGLHRIECPVIAVAVEDDSFEPEGVDRSAAILEAWALRRLGEVTFCDICEPPSAYFNLTTYRTWQVDPDRNEPIRRSHNCHARYRRRSAISTHAIF